MADKPKNLFRSLDLDRSKIDENKRTVELAFSSETPVERWWGENEILGHNKGEFDLTRLNDGAPLLLNHDTDQQIGVVESARIDSDKIGRAMVRFGNSPLANEIFQDVKDGIRKKVSFGYSHTGLIKSEKKDGKQPDARYSWRAHEITITPVPADNTVGVGRSENHPEKKGDKERGLDSPNQVNVTAIAESLTTEQKKHMRILLDPTAADGGNNKPAVIVEADVLKRGQEAERSRIAEIEATADALIPDYPAKRSDIDKLRRDHIASGKPADDFNRTLFAKLPEWRAENPTTMAGIGCSEKERKSYNYGRALQSVIAKGMGPGVEPDGFEGEVSKEIAKRSKGIGGGGFWVPFDRECKVSRSDVPRHTRADLQAGVFAQGGAGVQTDIYLPVIELLRNKMVTERLGVRTISGLQGNIAWPRQIAKSTPLFVPETFALTTSNPLLDQVLATPRRIGVTGAVSRQLILQEAFDPQNWLREDQMASLAVELDRVTMFGAGANSEPTGIFNTIGIGSVTFGAAATYAKIINFKTQLALGNALAAGMAYVTTPLGEEKLRTAAKIGSTFPIFIWEDGSWGDDTADGRMVGLRATATNQVPADKLAFGNFMDACKLLWGGINTLVNPYTRSKEDMVEITTNVYGDVLVRHQASFVYSSDNVTQ